MEIIGYETIRGVLAPLSEQTKSYADLCNPTNHGNPDQDGEIECRAPLQGE
jgi:hypothetical protein